MKNICYKHQDTILGKLGIELQGIRPDEFCTPIILFTMFTSATGPRIRTVPESAIAWHPPLQRLVPFKVILKNQTYLENILGRKSY
jgi:hypothetical protein